MDASLNSSFLSRSLSIFVVAFIIHSNFVALRVALWGFLSPKAKVATLFAPIRHHSHKSSLAPPELRNPIEVERAAGGGGEDGVREDDGPPSDDDIPPQLLDVHGDPRHHRRHHVGPLPRAGRVLLGHLPHRVSASGNVLDPKLCDSYSPRIASISFVHPERLLAPTRAGCD